MSGVRRPFLAITPEPRLAFLIALLSLVWLLPGSAGRIAGWTVLGLVAIVAIADAIALPTDVDLTVERTMPTSIGIGDRATGEYVVYSRWGLPLRARLADDLPVAVGGSSGGETELILPARGSSRLTTQLTGMTRGRFALGAVALRVRTRLGLMARRMRWTPDDAILVTPSVSNVRRFRLLAIQHRLY